jgi:hypothetical protein
MAASMTAAMAMLATPAVLAVLPAAPARAAVDDQIRSQEWWLGGIHVTQAWQFAHGSGVVSQVRQALVAGTVSPPGQPGVGAPGYGAGTLDALKAVQAATGITAAPAAAPATAPGSPGPAGQAGSAQARGAAGGTAGRAATTTGILGAARNLLRDAAMVAGLLIVVLVASLVGIRVRRRRPALAPRAALEPRMLLSAPVGPVGAVAAVRPVRPVAAAGPVAPAARAALAGGGSRGSGASGGGARHAKPPGERVPVGGVPPAGGAGGRQALAVWAAGPRPPWDPAPDPARYPVPVPQRDAAPVLPNQRPPALAGAGPVPDPPLPRRGPSGERGRYATVNAPAAVRDQDPASGPDTGPLYIWDPAALTDPFPAVPPRSLGEPDVPGR